MTDFAAIRSLFHITESCGFDAKELQSVVMNNREGYLLTFSAEDEQRFDALHEALLRLADGF